MKFFLTLILIVSISSLNCSSDEEKKEEPFKDYEEKSLTGFQLIEDLENHRLKGKIKKFKISTFSINPLMFNTKEKGNIVKYLSHEKTLEFDTLGRFIHQEYKMYKTKQSSSPPKIFVEYTDSIKIKEYYKYDTNNPKEVEHITFYVDEEIYQENIYLYKDTLLKKRFALDKKGKPKFISEHEYDKNGNLLWIEAIMDDGRLGIHKFMVKGNESIWNQNFRLNSIRWFNWSKPKKKNFGNFFLNEPIDKEPKKDKDGTSYFQDWGDFTVRKVEKNSAKLKTLLEDIVKLKKQEQVKILDKHGNCVKKITFSDGKIVDIFRRKIEYY